MSSESSCPGLTRLEHPLQKVPDEDPNDEAKKKTRMLFRRLLRRQPLPVQLQEVPPQAVSRAAGRGETLSKR
jgi:hypothetical protein